MKKYSDRVSELRNFYGLTRDTFAKLIDTKSSYLAHIEQGVLDAKGNPKEFGKDRERKLIEIFRLPYDYFMSNEPTLGDNTLSHDEILELLKKYMDKDKLQKVIVTYEIIEDKQ